MKLNFLSIAIIIALSAQGLFAQTNLDSIAITNNLKQHIKYLASDELQGRETGTIGERKAYEYIIEEFQKIGLEERGDHGFKQSFTFVKGRELGPKNALTIDKISYTVEKDFTPQPFYFDTSVTGTLVNVGYGIAADSLGWNEYTKLTNLKGKIFLMDLFSPDGNNPHGKYSGFADMETKVLTALEKGAAGIIFYDKNGDGPAPEVDLNTKRNKQLIPVIVVKGELNKKIKKLVGRNVTMQIDLQKIVSAGCNVIGYIDNNAAQTVVLSAHYDHLGMGISGSLHRGEQAIHNGADDNASGTAAIIELARLLINSDLKNNNYMFCAFSGEELGLLGSNYFVKNPTIMLDKLNYNINLDMVGRLKAEEPVLLVNGVGTSPQWMPAMNDIHSLKIKTTESGVAPSDNTSFYLNGLPAIHMFSGSHSDYHKPSDDEALINYPGEVVIIQYIFDLIKNLNDDGKLTFSKTNDANSDNAPRFKVTLGVVPDYAYEGEGMRIDGITDGRPAAKAGLQKGDIVIQIGEEKVYDMTSYMKALSKFKKGETTIVKVKRGEALIDSNLTF